MTDVHIQLPNLHKGQRQVLASKARNKVLLCGRQWGKTTLAIYMTIQYMIAGKDVCFFTDVYRKSKDWYKEILKYLPNVDGFITTQNISDLEIKLCTGGSVRLYSAESTQNIRGKQFDFCVLDEAAFFPDLKESWEADISGALSTRQAKSLIISTPKGRNFFYSLYEKGCNDTTGDWSSFHFASNTNPYFPKAEFEQKKRDLPDFQFAQEYLAVPNADKDNPFGIANVQRNTITALSTEPTLVYGIDIAISEIGDYTAIVGLSNTNQVTHMEFFRRPWELTKAAILQLPADVLKVIDNTSMGGKIAMQDLQKAGIKNLMGFNFTNESKNRIVTELIKDVQINKIQFPEAIANEMMTFEYKHTPRGNLTYNSASGFHDDLIIALALANSHKGNAVHSKAWKLKFY